MSKAINGAAYKRARKASCTKLVTVKESRIIFFGSPNDPDVQESRRRAEIAGRETEVVARPSFDTGIGPCGKHVCSCKGICKNEYAKSIAYPGDKGATLGASF